MLDDILNIEPDLRYRRDLKNMKFLAKLARAHEPVAGAKIASMIVYKNESISVGYNSRKSNPFQKKFGRNSDSIYLHSEIDAIKNALYHISVEDLRKCNLYVCRVKKDIIQKKIIWGLAKPCTGCTRAIYSFHIPRVIYSLDGDKELFKVWEPEF